MASSLDARSVRHRVPVAGVRAVSYENTPSRQQHQQHRVNREHANKPPTRSISRDADHERDRDGRKQDEHRGTRRKDEQLPHRSPPPL